MTGDSNQSISADSCRKISICKEFSQWRFIPHKMFPITAEIWKAVQHMLWKQVPIDSNKHWVSFRYSSMYNNLSPHTLLTLIEVSQISSVWWHIVPTYMKQSSFFRFLTKIHPIVEYNVQCCIIHVKCYFAWKVRISIHG